MVQERSSYSYNGRLTVSRIIYNLVLHDLTMYTSCPPHLNYGTTSPCKVLWSGKVMLKLLLLIIAKLL